MTAVVNTVGDSKSDCDSDNETVIVAVTLSLLVTVGVI